MWTGSGAIIVSTSCKNQNDCGNQCYKKKSKMLHIYPANIRTLLMFCKDNDNMLMLLLLC